MLLLMRKVCFIIIISVKGSGLHFKLLFSFPAFIFCSVLFTPKGVGWGVGEGWGWGW